MNSEVFAMVKLRILFFWVMALHDFGTAFCCPFQVLLSPGFIQDLMKMKAVCSFLTSGSDYTGTQHHIPEELHPLGYSIFFFGWSSIQGQLNATHWKVLILHTYVPDEAVLQWFRQQCNEFCGDGICCSLHQQDCV